MIEQPPLRPFQIEDAAALVERKRAILGACPGAGKSRTALKASRDANCVRTLIIALNSLKENWADEIQKWYPECTYTVVKSSSTVEQRDEWIRVPTDYTIIGKDQIIPITKYEKVVQPDGTIKKVPKETLPKNLPALLEQDYDAIIFDEAHSARSRKSKLTKTLKTLTRHVKYFWPLTGTYIYSSPLNVFPILNMLDDKEFSGYWAWAEKYFNKKRNYFSGYDEFTTLKSEEKFKVMLEPYYLPRTQAEVYDQIPDKQFTHIGVDLLPKQRKEYEQLKNKMMLELDDRTIFTVNGISNVIRLRQICLSTDLLIPESDKFTGAKLDLILDIIEGFGEDKWVIFCTWSTPLYRIAPFLRKHYNIGIITGDEKNSDRHKYAKAMDATSVTTKGSNDGCSNGGDSNLDGLLCSMGAGGIGANYTRANHAIFLNVSTIPAENEQAFARIDRRGQEKKCFGYNIYAKDTIEEKILNVGEDRDALFKSITPSNLVDSAIQDYILSRKSQ